MLKNSCKPRIDYPCLWQYKVIGTEEKSLQIAVNECVENSDYELTFSNISGGGKYVSLKLELTVTSEEQRKRLHQLLSDHKAVKVVL